MNYRLGRSGSSRCRSWTASAPGAPSVADGIRDQQLALKWVHDNIDIFHGDPANVTVFGESAGGTSTCIHVVSPASQGLANRFIIESGRAPVGRDGDHDPGASVRGRGRAQRIILRRRSGDRR